jgi:hypothetical protein
MEKTYAFVKDGLVNNIVVIDDLNSELEQHLKNEFSIDYIVEATDKTQIGNTFDGTLFWTSKPYQSWIKGEVDWVAPLSKPTDDMPYEWNELDMSWVEVPKPHESWIFNGNTWEAPSPKPGDDKFYVWSENELQWKEVIFSE